MVHSLRSKILLGFTVVVLLVTFISVWTITNIMSVRDVSSKVLTTDYRNIQGANRMLSALHQENAAILRYLAGDRITARQHVAVHQEEFHRALEYARQGIADTDDVVRLDSIARAYRHYSTTFQRMLELGGLDSTRSAEQSSRLQFFLAEVMPAYDTVIQQTRAFRDLGNMRADERAVSIEQGTRFTIISTAVIAGMILVLCVMASMKVLQTVLKPINTLSLSAQQVAEGNFDHEIEVHSADDELSGLIAHFNTMVRRLREYDQLKLAQIIAEKRRCEKIVSDLSDVVVATDEQGKIIYFNRQAELLIGVSAPLVLGAYIQEVALDNPLLMRMKNDIASNNTDDRRETIAVPVRDTMGTFNYEAQTIRDDAGINIGHVFRLTDITRFKQIDEIKTKMVATLSHELRTPLTSMGMSLELLLEEDMSEHLPPLQRELLQNMQEDLRRLQGFANDLLDISYIEAGRPNFHLKASSPRNLAERAVARIAPLVARQDIRIDTTGIAHDLPQVEVDTDRIVQVFNNLFSNAVRYTPLGGTIMVTARPADSSVIFAVRDNGPGIPEEESTRIFEKFYQVRDDQRAGGSGLGLAIVKEIVEAHGGRVWVKSAVGQGSTFYFALPIVHDIVSTAGSAGRQTADA
jgi:two-component system, NtrC family, sensor histidine kinase KinB